MTLHLFDKITLNSEEISVPSQGLKIKSVHLEANFIENVELLKIKGVETFFLPIDKIKNSQLNFILSWIWKNQGSIQNIINFPKQFLYANPISKFKIFDLGNFCKISKNNKNTYIKHIDNFEQIHGISEIIDQDLVKLKYIFFDERKNLIDPMNLLNKLKNMKLFLTKAKLIQLEIVCDVRSESLERIEILFKNLVDFDQKSYERVKEENFKFDFSINYIIYGKKGSNFSLKIEKSRIKILEY